MAISQKTKREAWTLVLYCTGVLLISGMVTVARSKGLPHDTMTALIEQQQMRPFHNLAIECIKSGKYREAKVYLEQVERSCESNSELAWKARFTIGLMYDSIGAHEAAWEHYIKAFRRRPLVENTIEATQIGCFEDPKLPVSVEGLKWFRSGVEHGAQAILDCIQDGQSEIKMSAITERAVSNKLAEANLYESGYM